MNASPIKNYQTRFQGVLAYVDEHLEDDLSIGVLSRVAGFSKYHFHRQFSALFGVSRSNETRHEEDPAYTEMHPLFGKMKSFLPDDSLLSAGAGAWLGRHPRLQYNKILSFSAWASRYSVVEGVKTSLTRRTPKERSHQTVFIEGRCTRRIRLACRGARGMDFRRPGRKRRFRISTNGRTMSAHNGTDRSSSSEHRNLRKERTGSVATIGVIEMRRQAGYIPQGIPANRAVLKSATSSKRSVFASRPIPLASFGSVIGIVGLGLAWRLAAETQRAPAIIGESIIFAGGFLFIALLTAWLMRISSNPHEIRVESTVAITASYLGAIVISISLFAAAAIPYSRPLAFALWVVAAAGGAALLLYLLGRWIEHGVEGYELTPAIFIPVVGNATSVYAAVPLGLSEFGWASFAIGALCWLALAPVVLYRLLAITPRLPRKMAPQLAVLVSSPAVLASSWFTLTGAADPVFKVLVFKAVFFSLLVVRLWKMAWGEPYNVAMWGWTFPAAALAGALERGASSLASPLYGVLATLALGLATLIVAACCMATVAGWLRLLLPQRQPASN